MISRRVSTVSFASEGYWSISSEIFSMMVCFVSAKVSGCSYFELDLVTINLL